MPLSRSVIQTLVSSLECLSRSFSDYEPIRQMTLKPYILAARPKTLPAAIVPVWLGCVLSWLLAGEFDVWLAFYTLMGAIWIQIGTNFFNDAIDADKGADTERRLGYKGLGEIFVVGFFGIIAVMGTVFVQLGEWRMEALMLGLQAGLLSAVLISINNLRDYEEDESNDKRTLAVVLGEGYAKKLLMIEIFLPAILGLYWLNYSIWLCVVPLVYLILAVIIAKGVLSQQPSAAYNKYLALGGLELIIFGVAFHLACV